jgi:hypothetical protein
MLFEVHPQIDGRYDIEHDPHAAAVTLIGIATWIGIATRTFR